VANANVQPRKAQQGTTWTDDWYSVLGLGAFWEPFWGVLGSFDWKGQLVSVHEHGDDYPTGVTFPVLVFAFQFIATIILVNLLIAQMADTYGRITSEGFLRWQFERAQLISEYKDTKQPLPPPLNVVYMMLAKSFALLFPPKDVRAYDGFKYVPAEALLRTWQQKELAALKMCLLAREKREKETPDAKVSKLQDLLLKQEEGTRRRFEDVNRKLEKLLGQRFSQGQGNASPSVSPRRP